MEKIFCEKYGREVDKDFIIEFYNKLKDEKFIDEKKPVDGIPFNDICELYITSTRIAEPERYKEVCDKIKKCLLSKRSLIDEVLEQVDKELGGKNVNVSATDLINSVTNRKTNKKLKNKTGIDFGSLIQNISKSVEQKINNGELDMAEVEKLIKKS